MIFTDKWSKQDNDIYRQLICERKSYDDILNIMGSKKLKYHPNNKYRPYISSIISNMKRDVPTWYILYDDVEYPIKINVNGLIRELTFAYIDIQNVDNIDMFYSTMKALLYNIKIWYNVVKKENVTFTTNPNTIDFYIKLMVDEGML